MKYYEELLERGCFTWADICEIVGNPNSAKNLLQNYLKKGYVKSVKRNLYVAINIADGMPVVNQYVIASHITENSYVSHHSALSYYGYTNQVYYDVFVSSVLKFNPFEFNGYSYRYIKSRINEGIIKNEDGSIVTDLERTIIDCINDFDKVGGLEELLLSLSVIPYADEEKMIYYLDCYDKQILYQKTGYLLEYFKSELGISDIFFERCIQKISKSIRYLYSDLQDHERIFNKRWKLYVPDDLLSIISQGGNNFAEI